MNDRSRPAHPKLRVCAVSYLNTAPLVWGFTHGSQQGTFDLEFALPADCADRLERREADIGIVPCAELPRLGLKVIQGTGIASEGPVRSILLVSRVPFAEIQTLAADASSRTSVILARILLARKLGVEPAVTSMKPDLVSMLEVADAALIIGDPALHLDPTSMPFHVADLGQEWTAMTGLPMVFAVWAGQPEIVTDNLSAIFDESLRYGLDHLDEIIGREASRRGIPETLAREYLGRHIRFRLGPREYEGMNLFLQYAAELGSLNPLGIVSA